MSQIEAITKKIDEEYKWLMQTKHTLHDIDIAFNSIKKFVCDLEQEPCEDCVSRQAVKEQMFKYGFLAPDMTVTEFIEDLPPVIPQPKTGHWIKSKDGYMRCDLCGSRGSAIKARFCHHCGAKMVELQKRSDKE